MKGRVLACAWMMSTAGCVGPMPYLSGPAIQTSLTNRRGGYRATYYRAEVPLTGSALVDVVADDPVVYARARSAWKQQRAGRTMTLIGAIAGGSLLLTATLIAGTWHQPDSDVPSAVVNTLAGGAIFGIFGLAAPGVLIMSTADRRTEEAVSLYNQHAAAR